jgi:hypothetical protein
MNGEHRSLCTKWMAEEHDSSCPFHLKMLGLGHVWAVEDGGCATEGALQSVSNPDHNEALRLAFPILTKSKTLDRSHNTADSYKSLPCCKPLITTSITGDFLLQGAVAELMGNIPSMRREGAGLLVSEKSQARQPLSLTQTGDTKAPSAPPSCHQPTPADQGREALGLETSPTNRGQRVKWIRGSCQVGEAAFLRLFSTSNVQSRRDLIAERYSIHSETEHRSLLD